MTPPNTPAPWAQCPKCGSTFFRDEEYRQYRVYASAVPGGGLQPSDEVRRIKTCMCGEPMPVNIVGRFDKVGRSLKESLAMARQYRESREPDKILAELALTFITRTEFQALVQRLDTLQTILGLPPAKDPHPPVPG